MLKKIMAALLAMVLCVSLVLPGTLAEGDTATFVQQYATDLMSGEKNEELYALFTDELKAQLPREQFDILWVQIEAMGGGFVAFGQEQEQVLPGMTAYLLPLSMNKQDLIMQLVVNEEGKVSTLYFSLPPEDKPAVTPSVVEMPEGIVEEDIVVGSGKWDLPGTMTLPKEGENFPAVVLVPGSGPQDRDETVGALKFMRDVAWSLAEQGIASVRYDKRSYVHGQAMVAELGNMATVSEEFIEDAILAGGLLKADARVDGTRIFLLGHSQGAMLGPRIAAESEDLFAGLVLVAGSPKSITEIQITQNLNLLESLPKEVIDQQMPILEEMIAQYEALWDMTPEERQQQTVFGLNGYYAYDMASHPAADYMKQLSMPAYILQGDSDFHVSLEDGVEAWQEALGEAENITFKVYPGLNHVLMQYTGPEENRGTVAEYDTPARLDDEAAEDIAKWILSQ